ncbi:MAG: hypothetical protein ACT4QD_20585 [Acidobacteriota bacterium]
MLALLRRPWFSAVVLAWLTWLLVLPPRPSAWLVWLSGLPLVLLGSWLAPRADGESWIACMTRTADDHAVAAMLLVALGVQFEDAHGVTTDGAIYFSQLRSVIFDRDLDVAAEFAFLGQPPRPYHVVPIGPTPVWIPLYLGVAVVDAVGRLVHAWPGPADPTGVGLTLPYVRAALVSSFAIGAAGLLIVHAHLQREFGRRVALATTVLLFGATPLVWYMVYEPSMTHAASFGFVAIFVSSAVRWTGVAITPRQSMALGALLGLAFISRPQEALFACLPAWLLVTAAGSWRERFAAAWRLTRWAFVGALPFLALQTVHSAILFSRESFSLVGAAGYLDFTESRWADTLWSSWHGFLSWTPVAYVALIGSAAYLRRQWRWAVAALAIVFLMAWVNGSTADWAAGWSFGGRRFMSCLVVLAPGLAYLIHGLTRRPLIAIGLIAGTAIGWNQLLVAQYAGGMLPPGEAVSFGQLVRQQAAVLTRPPFLYPFAFPANAWFAWRTGLPVDRYDLLGPELIGPSRDVMFDDQVDRFLLSGWSGRAADQWGPLRWMDQAEAALVIPLRAGSDASFPLHLGIDARTRLFDPPLRAVLEVSINGQQVGTLTPSASERSPSRFVVAKPVLTSGFNLIGFRQTGVVGPDGSPAAVDRPVPVAVYRVWVQTGGEPDISRRPLR